MPLGKEVDLVSGDIVLDGDSAPTKGHSPCTIFGPCMLWPNGWMDQDALGTEVGRGPGHSVFRWGTSSSERGTAASLSFRPISIVVAKRSPISATAEQLLL